MHEQPAGKQITPDKIAQTRGSKQSKVLSSPYTTRFGSAEGSSKKMPKAQDPTAQTPKEQKTAPPNQQATVKNIIAKKEKRPKLQT